MKEINKEKSVSRKKMIIAGIVFITLLGVAISGHLYRNSALKTVNSYVKAINNKNYIAAYEMFYNNKQLNDLSKEYITSYMNKYFVQNELIKIEKGKILKKSAAGKNKPKLIAYETTYYFKDKTIKASMGVIKENREWQVIFPFKSEELKVYAPIGSEIIVDNKKMIAKEEQSYINIELLPGQYTVKIKYPENIKEDYITEVTLPKQNEVYSPYKAYTIEVKAPLYTVVELAGRCLENTEGTVTFENVIEGEYTLQIYDKSNNINRTSHKISVSKDKLYFEIAQMSLSEAAYTKISDFTNQFYNDYLQGIKNKEVKFWETYLEGQTEEVIAKEYAEWFIDKKDILDSEMNIEIDKVALKNAAEIEMKILEVIHLKNKEKNEEVEYQIVLKWSNLIDISKSNYQIKERSLIESLVSYKDKEGNWLQY